MRPLIKWAGGKSTEIKYIKSLIPKFDRYIEAFFGGGALFFDLEPEKGIINDVTEELIIFYKCLKNCRRKEFEKELRKYVIYWERVNEYMEVFGDSIIGLYNEYKINRITEEEFIEEIKILFDKEIVPFNGLFTNTFCIDREGLLKSIEKNLVDKLNRVNNLIDPNNNFSDEEVMKNIETAFRSGFYIHFREIMNKEKRGMIKLSKEKKVANYYFIREFCYGGMFRFNQSGDFNVPYGGIAYNKKDFAHKVDYIFSKDVHKLLKRTTIENLDFDNLFEKYKFTEKDFIFLDPPYDTEFSEYEEHPFTKKDQERLAKSLYTMKAKFILIIKETPFIRKLYENKKGLFIKSFEKTYTYNIRGRNVREVRHLIIHNIEPSQRKLSNFNPQ